MTGRAVAALGQFLHRQEQGPDHGFRFRALLGVDEVAGLDPETRIDRHLNAFIDAGQDVLLGRIVAIGLGHQHGIGHGRDLARTGATMHDAARNLEALFIPRRLRLRIGLDPGLRLVDRFGRWGEFLNDTHGERLLGIEAFTLQDQWQSGLNADQAWQALGAASAWQEADLGFRQAELQLRIVIRRNAIMTGQRHFETAAEGEAIQRNGHRLAAGFQFAQRLVERKAAIELRLFQLCFGHVRRRLSGASALVHFTKIRPGAKAARLARRDHQALDGVIGRDFLGDCDDISDSFCRQRVHAAAWHIKDCVRNAVTIDVPTECFEFHIVYSVRLYLD